MGDLTDVGLVGAEAIVLHGFVVWSGPAPPCFRNYRRIPTNRAICANAVDRRALALVKPVVNGRMRAIRVVPGSPGVRGNPARDDPFESPPDPALVRNMANLPRCLLLLGLTPTIVGWLAPAAIASPPAPEPPVGAASQAGGREGGQDLDKILRRLEEEEARKERERGAERVRLVPGTSPAPLADGTSDGDRGRGLDEFSVRFRYGVGASFGFAPGFRAATAAPKEMAIEQIGIAVSFQHLFPLARLAEVHFGVDAQVAPGEESDSWGGVSGARRYEYRYRSTVLGLFAVGGVGVVSREQELLGRLSVGVGILQNDAKFTYDDRWVSLQHADGTRADTLPAIRVSLEFGISFARPAPTGKSPITGMRFVLEFVLALESAEVKGVAPFGAVGDYDPSAYLVGLGAAVTF